MSSISEVYCDKLVCTSPPDNFAPMGEQMNEIAESCGGHTVTYEDGYREVRMPNGGLILLQQRSSWSRVTINGQACAELRLFKRFNEALGVIGSFPHKVTHLHAKVDLRSKSTPKLLRKLLKVGMENKLFNYDFSELGLLPRMRPDRQVSNNLYVPEKQAEIQRAYYDKALERYKKLKLEAFPEDENISVELRVTGRVNRKGLSLRDASSPTGLYWHYMADCPLVGRYAPTGLPDWRTEGSRYEYPLTRRSDTEKLNDMMRFGGCIFQISKLSAQLDRGDELLKLVTKLLKQHCPDLINDKVLN